MKRYDEFVRHLAVLQQAHTQDLSNEFIVSGVIDKFFIQFELGWKLLKDLLRYEGLEVSVSGSPRTIIKEAYLLYDFLSRHTFVIQGDYIVGYLIYRVNSSAIHIHHYVISV